MPLYEIDHSFPLDLKQKTRLAEHITRIHSSTFGTPSLFVNVSFIPQDAGSCNYFVAGKPKENCVNRIKGMLRTGETRTKADFDAVAEKIEQAWYEVVLDDVIQEGRNQGKRVGEVEDSEVIAQAKKLLFVTIYPMMAARELGTVIPKAGEEKIWFNEYKSYFQSEADAGNKDFAYMLHEVETREELRKILT